MSDGSRFAAGYDVIVIGHYHVGEDQKLGRLSRFGERVAGNLFELICAEDWEPVVRDRGEKIDGSIY